VSNLADQYANSVRMADELGLPRPQRPRRRQAKMPPLPQAARGARARVRKASSAQGRIDLANRLWSKLEKGTAAVGPGIVGYASIPESIRSQANLPYPVTGWDPNKLEPDERALLTRMVSMNERPEQEATPEEIAAHQRRIASQKRSQEVQAAQEAQQQPWVPGVSGRGQL